MNPREYPRCGMKVYEGETGAGLPVFVFPMPGFQTKAAVLAVKYGSCDRRFRLDGKWTETPSGIAHYLEHKMFDMPDDDILERMSALGADPNAYTGFGVTGYDFSCAERFEECLALLLESVTTPYFTEESVAAERGIIAQEIKMAEDDPSYRVDQNLLRALYGAHPVRDPITGSADSVDCITAEKLYDCHRAFYNPRNMVLCCAGELDPERIALLAEKWSPPPAALPERDYGDEASLSPASVRIEERMEVSMPLFELGAKLPWRGDDALWTRDLLVADLGCELMLGRGAPLYSALYDLGLINQSFCAGTDDFPRGGICCAGGRCPDPTAVLGRITDAAEAFSMDASARARLERLKRARLGSFLMSLDAPEELPDLQAECFFAGWERMDYPALVDSVRPQEVERFLKETFRPERLAMSVITPN